MMIYIADFILGLFVGMLALASCAPKSMAVAVYRNSWIFFGFFLFSAYQTTHSPQHIVSVALLLGGGMYYIQSLDLQHKLYKQGLLATLVLLVILSFFTHQAKSLVSTQGPIHTNDLITLVITGIVLVLTVGLFMVRKHAHSQGMS